VAAVIVARKCEIDALTGVIDDTVCSSDCLYTCTAVRTCYELMSDLPV